MYTSKQCAGSSGRKNFSTTITGQSAGLGLLAENLVADYVYLKFVASTKGFVTIIKGTTILIPYFPDEIVEIIAGIAGDSTPLQVLSSTACDFFYAYGGCTYSVETLADDIWVAYVNRLAVSHDVGKMVSRIMK